jgi:hypothetical protein
METIPPFFTELMDQCSAVADPPCISSFLPRTVCSALPAGLGPHGVDTNVGPQGIGGPV